MSINVTYLFGAGASYNALPLVKGFGDRFEMFCNHLSAYLESEVNKSEFDSFNANQEQLIKNIRTHYTVDTYAKKLFLKNPILYTNPEYTILTNYLSAYFIYEQLNIDINIHCNRFLKDIAYPVSEGIKSQKIIVTEILNNFDYRYDSFFASILKHDENSNIVVPDNINFISWNYDFQIEKAFMNFKNCSLNEAIEGLNMFATPQEIFEKPATSSHLIKLNGTAGFLKDGKFSELFDFSEHNLDNTSFSIYKDILLSRRNKIQNAIRFSWEGNPLRDKAINLAQQKITNSKIVVVIGYSFPYFNREIDRLLFARLPLQSDLKVYIQLPKDSIDSVIARFKGVAPNLKVEAFTETDQFLIPNELT